MGDSSEARDVLLNQLADELAARHRAGEQPSLGEYCDRHPELADEIRELFPALLELEQAKADAVPEQPASPVVTRLGDFHLLREIGRGGMGVVYEAEQLSLGRRVAIKLLPTGLLRDAAKRRRFEREAKAAAKLHHSNIVPVHGFGEQDSTPYYVMQFIPGLGLDVVIDELSRLQFGSGGRVIGPSPDTGRTELGASLARSLVAESSAKTTGWHVPAEEAPLPGGGALTETDRGLSASFTSSSVALPGQPSSAPGSSGGRKATYWESVARIGAQVAAALSYAHKQGILHRDIKPANLLLDLDGVVWVTDFGLAKADDSDNLTNTGDLLGTLRYMPPEAFEGKADARGDIYALGLTLFELVALRPAYDEKERNKLIKQVSTAEPARLRKLRRDAPRDLVTIVEKAIDKDPARRYQTAGALADDLGRFLDGRPIAARRTTELERLWMWARRQPVIAGLVAALFACLLTGAIVSTVFAIRADESARGEKALRDRAEALRQGAETARDEAVEAREEARQARNAAARQAAALWLDRGIEDARGGEPARALHLFVRALRALPAGDKEAAGLERVIRANLTAWAETVPALEHIWSGGPRCTDGAFSPDGERVALPVANNELRCFRTDTGQPVGPAFSVAVGKGAAIAFAPDGRSLWVAAPGRHQVVERGAIHRIDVASGRAMGRPIPTTAPLVDLVVTPDGQHLVGAVAELHPDDRGGEADADGTRKWRTKSIVVWSAQTGEALRTEVVNAEVDYVTASEFPDTYLRLSADGETVTAWVARGPHRFEELSFPVVGKGPVARRKLPAMGRNGPWKFHFDHHLRTGLALKDGQLHRWSAAEPGALGPGVPAPFRSMHYPASADGRSVFSVTDGRAFDIGAWPPRPSGVRLSHPGWQRSPAPVLAQSLDGRFAATWIWVATSERRLWRLPRPHSRPALPANGLAGQPARRDHKFDARLGPGGASAVLWWAPQDHRPQAAYQAHSIQIVDVTTGAIRVASRRHSAMIREVAFTPDGRYFATASFDSTAQVWETATGRPAGPPLRHRNYVATVAFSPDGKTLAAGDYGAPVNGKMTGFIQFWDWRTGKEARPALAHDDIVLSVNYSSDGRHLAVVKSNDWSNRPEFLVWEVASGKAAFRDDHTAPSYTLREQPRFRPDNRAVTTRDINGTLRLWEVPSGKPLGQLPLDGNGVTRFSPDGRVVAASANLGVRLLDGATLVPLHAGYLPHPDPITDVAFSPDGALLLTGHETGSAQLWDVATRKPLGPPAVLLGAIRAVGFTQDGKTCLCVAADGTVRRWPVPAPLAEPDLARLADRVALMTGQKMDDNQGLENVSADDWRALRAKLAGDGSTALVAPRPDADWHEARAADAEQDGDVHGARWHLERLAARRPGDWTIAARLGRALAAAGQWDEAADAYVAATCLARSAQVVSDWLRAAATDEEALGRKQASAWGLSQAIALTPDDWVLYALRARVVDPVQAVADLDEAIRRGAEGDLVLREALRSGEAGDWKRSASLFTRFTQGRAVPAQYRYLTAIACLKAGDAAGYRACCTEILKRLPPVGEKLSPGLANSAAAIFALGPAATTDWKKPLAWIDHALAVLTRDEKEQPEMKERFRAIRHDFLNTRGTVLYRAGRFADAAKALREGMSLRGGKGSFEDWLFLALAEHHRGQADEAKKAAARARTARKGAKDASAWDKAEVELLLAELDAVLPPG